MSFNVAGSSTNVPVIPSSDLLTVEEVRRFNAEELNGFLKRRLNNIDNEIDALTAEKVDGEAFLELTPEDLTKLGILLGPAKKILKLINEIKRGKRTSLARAFIFVNNTKYLFLCFSFCFLSSNPPKKHIRAILDQPVTIGES